MRDTGMRLLIITLCLILAVSPLAAAEQSKLQRGDSGDQVLQLQINLNSLGYTLVCDGKYGIKTLNAVKAFQKDQGLTVDGVAGQKTLNRIAALISGGSSPTAAPTAAPTATASGSSLQATVTGGSLNLRSAPVVGNNILYNLPDKAWVEVLEKGTTWSKVRYNGLEGYCMTAYLLFAGSAATPTAAPTATAAPSGSVLQATVTGGSLNLRNAPSTAGAVITSMPNGSSLEVLERGSIWCRVRYNGREGYCMTAFLIIGGSVTAAPTAQPTAAPGTPAEGSTLSATVTGGSLNLRSAASTAAKVLLSMPNGSQVTVTSYGAQWCAVTYGSVAGYAMTRYLKISSATSAPTAAPTAAPGAPTAAPTATAAPYDTDLFTRTLRPGYTGQDVTALQQRLVSLNYLSAVSGTYDDATTAAVKTFQSLHGLTSDGLAGEKTLTILFSAGATPYDSGISGYSTLHIYYGSQDTSQQSAVLKMQQRLQALGYTVKANSTFDETTYMAVVNFQLRNGLSVTGSATPAMQAKLYSADAKGMSATPSLVLGDDEGVVALPDTGSIKLLHWYNTVKPLLTTGSTLTVIDPNTRTQYQLRVLSCGRHADCEPLTLKDTLLMFRSLGNPSWTVHPVYVLLPNGEWTMATTHDRPHLTGTIAANGFDGHLCVHFLRDMDECKQNDPDYGVTNQNTLREAWKALTGETVN